MHILGKRINRGGKYKGVNIIGGQLKEGDLGGGFKTQGGIQIARGDSKNKITFSPE